VSKHEAAIVLPWIKQDASIQLWKQEERIFAFPASLEKELLIIAGNLYIRNAGVGIGKIAGDSLVPDHALAVSALVSGKNVVISLKKEDALQFLRKEEVHPATTHRGWALVQYEHVNLGWVKILPNRTNNYYPKEWRILKKL
jgi:NOL1/NOP2/fmu family ribosome biogenesis protein